MKKTIVFFFFFLCACGCFAQDALMLIRPWRETFVNFPSTALGNTHTVTVFLPEQAVPLKGRYPVVYILQAGPKQAEQAKAFLDNCVVKALVVGLDFSAEELADVSRVVQFFSKELIPYIDTNYPTYAYSQSRVISGQGPAAAKVAASLLSQPGLFRGASLVDPGEAVFTGSLPAPLRLFIRAGSPQVAAWQSYLEEKGFLYGRNFVYLLSGSSAVFDNLPLAYLLGDLTPLSVKKVELKQSAKKLSLQDSVGVELQAYAVFNGGLRFDFLPSALRFSPPYLRWNAATQRLFVLSGAEAGTVKISGFAGRIAFETKIKLKKQEK